MSWSKGFILVALLASTTLVARCTTTDTMQREGMIQDQPDIPAQPTVTESPLPVEVSKAAESSPVLRAEATSPHYMKHTLREIVEYDVSKMQRLVNHEINLKEHDESIFLNQAAATLGQTIMIQTHFTERESALREFKGKIDQEDYMIIIDRAVDGLLSIYKTSPYASDQAGSLVALTNIVVEIKALKRQELKATLQKISGAHLKVKDDAQKYARESMERLTSPSSIADDALRTM